MTDLLMDDFEVVPPPAPARKQSSVHGATDFISWTWEMVNAGHDEVGWSADGERIVVSNPERLATMVLPIYFRHAQYASWVRALNAYNFRKARAGQWYHPHFQQDRPELLKLIVRKPSGKSKAAGGSTQLVRVAPSRPPLEALLMEEKSRLAWLQHQLKHLEAEARGLRDDDYQQKVAIINMMYMYAVQKRKNVPRLHLKHDAVGEAFRGLAQPSSLRLTYKQNGEGAGARDEAGTSADGQNIDGEGEGGERSPSVLQSPGQLSWGEGGATSFDGLMDDVGMPPLSPPPSPTLPQTPTLPHSPKTPRIEWPMGEQNPSQSAGAVG